MPCISDVGAPPWNLPWPLRFVVRGLELGREASRSGYFFFESQRSDLVNKRWSLFKSFDLFIFFC